MTDSEKVLILEQRVAELPHDRELLASLLGILMDHVGERGTSEGAVEVLNRIVDERGHAEAALAAQSARVERMRVALIRYRRRHDSDIHSDRYNEITKKCECVYCEQADKALADTEERDGPGRD